MVSTYTHWADYPIKIKLDEVEITHQVGNTISFLGMVDGWALYDKDGTLQDVALCDALVPDDMDRWVLLDPQGWSTPQAEKYRIFAEPMWKAARAIPEYDVDCLVADYQLGRELDYADRRIAEMKEQRAMAAE